MLLVRAWQACCTTRHQAPREMRFACRRNSPTKPADNKMMTRSDNVNKLSANIGQCLWDISERMFDTRFGHSCRHSVAKRFCQVSAMQPQGVQNATATSLSGSAAGAVLPSGADVDGGFAGSAGTTATSSSSSALGGGRRFSVNSRCCCWRNGH